MKTIIITGGHHNSALVVAKDLLKNNFKVIWLGHRYAARSDSNDSAEYLEVTKAGIPFHELLAGKLDSNPSLTQLLNIPLGFIRAWRYLYKFKPSAVLSFGGYLGLAATFPASLMGIPVFLHEQTVIAGRANILTGKFARKIYLTWPDSTKFFPGRNTKVVGLPLRQSLLSNHPQKIFSNKLPTILIMGGKQGSHIINTQIFTALPAILTHYNLIHQTGTSSVTGDYQAAVNKKQTLSKDLAARYLPLGYIEERELASYLSSADLYLGRSGAHTAYELAVLGKRSVLIPFMHTTGSEQHLQAQLLEKSGLSIILPENELTTPRLIRAIHEGLNLESTNALNLPRDASEKLVADLINEVS